MFFADYVVLGVIIFSISAAILALLADY